jgi:tetratricopeptide (TPR) repeat protein
MIRRVLIAATTTLFGLSIAWAQPFKVAPSTLDQQPTIITPIAQEQDAISPIASTVSPEDKYQAQNFDIAESQSQILSAYTRSRSMIANGDWAGARNLLVQAIREHPESRHLHLQLAELLWYIYKDQDGGTASLAESNKEVMLAANIGLKLGTIDDSRTLWLASQTLGTLHDTVDLDRVFNAALLKERSAYRYLLYAKGLELSGDPRAEDAFRSSLALEPGGQTLPAFGEWLLDQGRDQEVLELIPANDQDHYPHFLRGVAFERLGKIKEAKAEYKQYSDFSKAFPAPQRFLVGKGIVQAESGINFVTSIPETKAIPTGVSSDQTINGLSYLINGEAGGESRGGQRAVGWVVHNRALRGALAWDTQNGVYCPGNTNSGSTLADQYASVMCTSGQFNGVCLAWCSNPNTTACGTPSSAIHDVAYNVYFGFEPDPVSGHCPHGITTGSDVCADNMRCGGGGSTYRIGGGMFFYGTSLSCPTQGPPFSGCTTSNSSVALSGTNGGKVCGLGGRDNCFYINPQYGLGTYTHYTGTCTGTGTSLATPNIIVSSARTLQAHLEGPEGPPSNPDFDLYLESFNSATSQWSFVSSSQFYGTVEDVKSSISTGTYRWRIYCYQGTGGFNLYTKP